MLYIPTWLENDSELLDLVDKDCLVDPTLGASPVLLKDYLVKTKQERFGLTSGSQSISGCINANPNELQCTVGQRCLFPEWMSSSPFSE